MALPINSATSLPPVIRQLETPGVVGGATSAGSGDNFAGALLSALHEAGDAERAAEVTGKKFAEGDASVGIHEAMIAMEKASVAIHYAVTLKNKALEAYKELMNTPV